VFNIQLFVKQLYTFYFTINSTYDIFWMILPFNITQKINNLMMILKMVMSFILSNYTCSLLWVPCICPVRFPHERHIWFVFTFICFVDVHVLFLLFEVIYVIAHSYFDIRWCSCHLTIVKRWMPLVEQELLTFPEHLSLPLVSVGFVFLNIYSF
jgi:hypothetical protein